MKGKMGYIYIVMIMIFFITGLRQSNSAPKRVRYGSIKLIVYTCKL